VAADNRCLNVKGIATLNLRIASQEISQDFYVIESLSHPVILGMDCLKRLKCILNCATHSLAFPEINALQISEEVKMMQLLNKYFPSENFVLGTAKSEQHKIYLKPIRQPLRRSAYMEREIIDKPMELSSSHISQTRRSTLEK
jgi:hypothetical protein